ncbi:MAG: Phospholipase D precursor [Spirochaetes bacterium ADurb.Bin133]|nr:MAG: Phospholipase D precursor [Spirochaetes bacterium ADurb.Bin133]
MKKVLVILLVVLLLSCSNSIDQNKDSVLLSSDESGVGTLGYKVSFTIPNVISKLNVKFVRTDDFRNFTYNIPCDETSISINMLDVVEGKYEVIFEGVGDDDAIYFYSGTAQSVEKGSYQFRNIELTQIKVTPVNIDADSGVYRFDREIRASCATPGVEIRWTMGEDICEDPDVNSMLYASSIPIAGDGVKRSLKFIGYKTGLAPSEIILRNYEISYFNNIEIYFTEPGEDTTLDDTIIELIDNQSTVFPLDVAIYGLDRENIILALERAIEKGVRIRFVGNLDGYGKLSELSGDYYRSYFRIADALDKKFPIDGKKRVDFPESNGFDDFALINSSIMHDKFMLFATGDGAKYLYTGSTNMTDTCFLSNNNNSLIIKSDDIVAVYRKQFEYMLGLEGSAPETEISKRVIDGAEIEVLFAPNTYYGRTTIDYIIDSVCASESSIYFMIYSFTHTELTEKIVQKFQDGLKVEGIYDESQLYYSKEEYLKEAGVPYKIDGNYFNIGDRGGKLHHKVMILDWDKDNATVITGSSNWSDNAANNNDENILIIKSKEIASLYKREWDKRRAEGASY